MDKELIIKMSTAGKTLEEKTTSTSINALDKNPVIGGIPPSEKKTKSTINDKVLL